MVMDKVVEKLQVPPQSLKLAFIPTARDPYHIAAETEPEKEKLLSLGFQVIVVDIKNKSKEQLSKELQGVDILFVAGENIFYLLEKTRESGFDEIIKELVEKGVIYVGASAGSMLVGPDIEIAKELDDPSVSPKLKSTNGLGLVDFIILPHSGTGAYGEQVKKVYEKWKDSEYTIIPISDHQAVYVEDNGHSVIE